MRLIQDGLKYTMWREKRMHCYDPKQKITMTTTSAVCPIGEITGKKNIRERFLPADRRHRFEGRCNAAPVAGNRLSPVPG